MLRRACLLWICLVAFATTSMVCASPVTRMVPVEKSVRLEVLDWGGSGRPLVLLAGFGGTAHTFEGFAERFTASHHVYAITRRGFGKSSHPAPTVAAYSPERLAADDIAVIQALHLERPFVAGHSIAGQELSEIGTHYPGQVSGLIYLDATGAEAFYGPSSNVLYPIAGEVRRDLNQLIGSQPSEAPRLVEKIKAELPRLERGLDWYEVAAAGAPDRPSGIANSPVMAIQHTIVRGEHIYGPVKVPVLSIVALPLQCAPDCQSEASKRRETQAEAQVADFSRANPSAKVIKIPYADHFVWESDDKTVIKAMDAFMNIPR